MNYNLLFFYGCIHGISPVDPATTPKSIETFRVCRAFFADHFYKKNFRVWPCLRIDIGQILFMPVIEVRSYDDHLIMVRSSSYIYKSPLLLLVRYHLYFLFLFFFLRVVPVFDPTLEQNKKNIIYIYIYHQC